MQLFHDPARVSVAFDEANLVSCAGLVPVMALAERVGLSKLARGRLSVPSPHAPAKVAALVAGMVAGADSIADMDLLRHGALPRLFTGARAPSTLGTFLRAFTFGHVRQLDALASRLLAGLSQQAPLLPGAEVACYLDVDDTIRATHGYAKQGAAFGYSRLKGLNVQLAAVSTPLAAPVIAATRLRRGNTASAHGAAHLVAEALATARRCGADPRAGSLVVVRADSAYYTADVVAAARRAGARFSITARMGPTIRAAIGRIDEAAWTAIHYPNAFTDPDTGELVSDAEVAEVPAFTAFVGRRKHLHVTARLIVRRVKRLNPRSERGGAINTEQGELFATWRHHVVFTDSPQPMLAAEADHRGHAIIEQVIADLKAGPLAHLPSGKFTANAAWTVLATIAFNLTRAAGVLATTRPGHGLAVATTATLRTRLITVPARLARSARRLTLHLPHRWPWREAWQNAWTRLAASAHSPPRAA